MLRCGKRGPTPGTLGKECGGAEGVREHGPGRGSVQGVLLHVEVPVWMWVAHAALPRHGFMFSRVNMWVAQDKDAFACLGGACVP